MIVLRIIAIASVIFIMVKGYAYSHNPPEWIKLNTSKEFDYYVIDKYPEILGKNRVGTWVLFDRKGPHSDAFQSFTAYFDVDCDTNQIRSTKEIHYAGHKATGEVVNKFDTPQSPFLPTTSPCTLDTSIVQRLCKK